jgi:drug/metabolite transporter (DMT)-like permease
MLTLGNSVWKLGLIKTGGFMTNNLSVAKNLYNILLSPYMWLGGILYVAATFWWFYLMSKENLSYLYPLASIGYVLTMLVGVFVFREEVPPLRWVGMLIVIIGFAVMAKK